MNVDAPSAAALQVQQQRGGSLFGLPLRQGRTVAGRKHDPDRTPDPDRDSSDPSDGAAQDLDEDSRDPDPERERLVNLAREGDAEAFGAIYDLYVETVFRYVFYRTRDRALAEDLTSETFLRAWRRIDTFIWQGRDIGAWLVRIARNLLFDHVKSSRYRLELTTADLIEPSDAEVRSTEEIVAASALSRELVDHIKQLSSDQQECLVLRFFEGMSVAETAVIMGKKEGAVKALQHRAVRRLESFVDPELSR